MKNTKTVLSLSVGLAMGLAGSANALPFFGADTLSINPGAFFAECTHDTVSTSGTCFSTSLASAAGSYFRMSGGAYGSTLVEGFDGITLGSAQPPGIGSHTGSCLASDIGAVTKPFTMFSNCGHNFSTGTGINTSAATSDPNSLSASGQTLALSHPNVDGHHFLGFSNWRMTWSGIPSLNLGGGLQDCGTSTDGICDFDGTDTGAPDIAGTFFNGSGLAHVACFTDSAHTTPQTSCSASSFYVAEYAAVVPQADPSTYGGVLYELKLEGQVSSAVPVPAALWLFGSGLLSLIGVVRQKKTT